MSATVAVFACPLCGKPMSEEAKFPGLWLCPDGKVEVAVVDGKHIFACDGMHLTKQGANDLLSEMNAQADKRWQHRN